MKKMIWVLVLALMGCGKEVVKDPKGPSYPKDYSFINKPLVNGGNVTDRFVITPDGHKVVYIADEDQDNVFELYSANVDGTNKRRISAPLSLGRNVSYFLVSPNSQKVAYIADHTDDRFNLYTVNLDGSNFAQVNQGQPDSAHQIGWALWTPNSSKLVYTTDEYSSVGNYGLFIANPDGSARLTLNAGPVMARFDISANGARVVYREGLVNPNLKSITPSATDDKLLNTPFNLGSYPASGVFGFVISPNSNLVLFRSNQLNNAVSELFVASIDTAGTAVKVSGTMVSGGNVEVTEKTQYNFTPDSLSVVYLADQQTNNVDELFISSVTGSSNQKLNGSLVSGGNVINFKILSSKILFLADASIDGVKELFTVDYNGSNLLKINTPLIAGENVSQYDADETNIVYLSDMDNSGVYSVFSNDFTGIHEEELSEVSGGPGAYDAAADFARQIVLKDEFVFYRSGNTSSDYQLYKTPVYGGGSQVVSAQELGVPVVLPASAQGSFFLITPDGLHTVYRMTIHSQTNLLSSIAAFLQ